MSIKIKDKFSQLCGTVEITLQVQESNLTTQFDGVKDEGPPTIGIFEIQEIHLTNLKNTGKNYSFIFLKI